MAFLKVPPVSMSNCRRYQRHRRQICHWYQWPGGKFCHQFPLCCCHQRPWHQWQIAAGINNIGGKFATGINDTGGKFTSSLVVATGVVNTGCNLPPASLTPAAICRRYHCHRWQICHWCQQHKGNWWQNLSPVLLIPVANLPAVSTTPVANNWNNIRLQTP